MIENKSIETDVEKYNTLFWLLEDIDEDLAFKLNAIWVINQIEDNHVNVLVNASGLVYQLKITSIDKINSYTHQTEIVVRFKDLKNLETMHLLYTKINNKTGGGSKHMDFSKKQEYTVVLDKALDLISKT